MQIIKQLRQQEGINQSDLAVAIGVSLRTIQLYEKRDASIPMKNLNKIADYFDLTVGELFMQEINEERGTYAKRKIISAAGNICYPLQNGKYLVMAPLLFADQHDRYINKNEDKEIKRGLVKVGFVVDYLGEGSYMAFEITGNAMDDGSINSVPNGTLVLGRSVNAHEEGLYKNSDMLLQKIIVVVFKSRIVCKRFTGFNAEKGTLLFDNLNTAPEYKDFEMPLSEVLEMYEVVKKQL